MGPKTPRKKKCDKSDHPEPSKIENVESSKEQNQESSNCNIQEPSKNDNPFPQKPKIQLFEGDCMTLIDSLENNSLDCIITDPPYFTDKLDHKWNSEKIADDTKNSHIQHLPKGMKFDKKQVKDLQTFYKDLSTKLITKLKPGGYFLSFSSPRLYHAIAMGCDEAGFEVRDMMNWIYTQTMPKGMSISHLIDKNKDMTPEEKSHMKEEYKDHKTPMIRSCAEPICIAMKPIETSFLENEKKYKTGLLDFSQKVGEEADKVPSNVMTTQYMDPIYDKHFFINKPSKDEKGDYNSHPTVKPIALMEHLVKLFTKPDAIVLDPFSGSGTTLVACKNTGRRAIGFEMNNEYYEICKKRLF